MLNQVILIGRLTRDPTLNYTGQGRPVANFPLAIERNFKNKNGERDVDFIDVVAWNKQAELVAKHLGKGRLVGVTGRLQIRKNIKKDRTYINPEVIASEVRFLDWPKNNSQQSSYHQNQNSGLQQSQNSDSQCSQSPAPADGDEDYIDVPF